MPESKPHARIIGEVLSTPWLITEEWLHTIYSIACRENLYDPEALTAKRLARMENSHRAKQYNSIAVIPISGPIFPKSNLMTEYSGATSAEAVARDLQSAMDNSDIERIILDIDSPGGHVTGINELANIIRTHTESKQITAYVAGTGASAAYWLASAASEIVVDATSRVGSVGVVTAFPKSNGDTIEIVNSASPNKRPDITTEEGKKVVVDQMDALADVFISSVAGFRNTTVETVKKDFGRGGVLIGEHAVKAGMADRLGSFDQLLTENGGKPMPAPEGKTNVMTLATLKEKHGEVYQEAFNEGAASTNSSMAAKDAQISSLQTELASTKDANTELSTRVTKLERNDIIRQEKEIANTASNIFSVQLAKSSIPPRLQAKVTAPKHESFITDGVLDVKGYQAAVDAEISDWEKSIEVAAGPVQGFGRAQRAVDYEEDDDDGYDDAEPAASDPVADKLISFLKK